MNRNIDFTKFIAIKLNFKNVIIFLLIAFTIVLIATIVKENTDIQKFKSELASQSSSINELETRIDDLENTDFDDRISDLESRIDDLENK